jgi:hypothetical protein
MAFKSCVVVPLLHRYVYPGVPPAGVIFIAPVLPPKQSTLVVTPFTDNAAAGWVIVAEYRLLVHPFASVTVTF